MNTHHELSTREAALQIVCQLAEYKPKQLVKHNLTSPLVSALCNMCAEPIPEDWDDTQQLPAQKFACQVSPLPSRSPAPSDPLAQPLHPHLPCPACPIHYLLAFSLRQPSPSALPGIIPLPFACLPVIPCTSHPPPPSLNSHGRFPLPLHTSPSTHTCDIADLQRKAFMSSPMCPPTSMTPVGARWACSQPTHKAHLP